MFCPSCREQMVDGERLWVCLRCGRSVPLQNPLSTISPQLDLLALPGLVALPIRLFLLEKEPVHRLWRLCDAIETLLRYIASIALAEATQRRGLALVDVLGRDLLKRLERPTFPDWVALVRRSLETERLVRGAGKSSTPLPLIKEMRRAVKEGLLPWVGTQVDSPKTHVLPLRNTLAHIPRLSLQDASELLGAQLHEQKLMQVLDLQASWLISHELVYIGKDGSCLQLKGLELYPIDVGKFENLHLDELENFEDKLVVLAQGARPLNLTPLCGFWLPHIARLGRRDLSGSYRVPQVYVRTGSSTLLYSVLQGDIPFSEHSGPIYQEFLKLLYPGQLSEVDSSGYSFDDELAEEARFIIGRQNELEWIVTCLVNAQKGVFWLSGRPGVGKSMLVAALSQHPILTSHTNIIVVVHRFISGDGRCSYTALLVHLVEALEKRLGKEIPGAIVHPLLADTRQLRQRLDELIRQVAYRKLSVTTQPQKLIVILDGVDEVHTWAAEVLDLPFQLNFDQVVWLCVGRPEPALEERFSTTNGVKVLFPKTQTSGQCGLPSMTDGDLRAMLLSGTHELRYQILRQDRFEQAGYIVNTFVEAVVTRAEGLPIYVQMVLDDLVRGNLRVIDGHEDLPESIHSYYASVLRRYGVSDLAQVLTPLLATIAVAEDILDPDELHTLLAYREIVDPDEGGERLVHRALDLCGGLIRRIPKRDGSMGYTLFHESLHAHFRDADGATAEACSTATDTLLAAVLDWKEPQLGAVRSYLLRWGVSHLLKANEVEAASKMLCDFSWLMDRFFYLESEGVPPLLGDFQAVQSSIGTDDRLDYWSVFFRTNAHLFMRPHPEITLLQKAISIADRSEITIALR